VIEFIDGCGWDPVKFKYRRKIQDWFEKRLPEYQCVAVFPKRIQVPGDKYCAFWPLFYVYMRIVKGLSRAQFKRFMRSRPINKRLEIIEDFWQTSVSFRSRGEPVGEVSGDVDGEAPNRGSE
jgi:hypothetical protein